MTEVKLFVDKDTILRLAAEPRSSLQETLTAKFNIAVLQAAHAMLEEGLDAEKIVEAIKALDLDFLSGVGLTMPPVMERDR